MTVAEWLTERMDNCHRLAAQKNGVDRAGWLDDAEYFRLAVENAKDAERWRCLSENKGQEYDLSSGPGSAKILLVRIDVSGCEKYLESGAPDWRATLNAALDSEIKIRRA